MQEYSNPFQMKHFFILPIIGFICLSCGNGVPKSIREWRKEHRVPDAVVNQMVESAQEICAQESVSKSKEWPDDILTVENCLRTQGKPKEMFRHGDTLTLIYGQEHECISMVYVRDTLDCEIID